VRAEPTALLHGGRLLHEKLRRERVVEEEVLQAVRSAGHASLARVRAVVLETDGSFSVVGFGEDTADTLRNVGGIDQPGETC
jgi:uncharacterized membrane protein YcaP (DUF421 family)